MAAGGVAAGFTAALLFNYFKAASSRTDGAAVPEQPDTSGNTWEPIHAIEMDDLKVCAGYRHVGVLRHVYGAKGGQGHDGAAADVSLEEDEDEDDGMAYRDLGVGLLLGFGLLLRVSAAWN